MIEPRAIRAEPHAAFLPEHGSLRRMLRAPTRNRPAAIAAGYEDRALVYDAFRYGIDQVLLVGPPPRNLATHYRTARYETGGRALEARHHVSMSTMVTELRDVPANAESVTLHLAGGSYEIGIGASLVEAFAGRRLLFTMSKDNDLDWIAEWAHWHQRVQGADAVLFFDNGSSAYGLDEIEATLLGVPGIERVSVVSWPWRYGVTDRAVLNNPFYVLYLQVSAMSVALRRFGMAAEGIVNADIDELVATPSGTTIFELIRASRMGLISMSGTYIEPVPTPDAPAKRTHRHYQQRLADDRAARSRPRKWAIDPSRKWFGSLDVHPYMHWIEGRPAFSKSTPRGVFYRHFRAINTNWKDERTAARPGELMLDADFARLVAYNAF